MPSVFKFKRGFKSQSEKKSIELRQNLSIKPSHPLPGKLLAEHLKTLIVLPESIPGLDRNALNCLLKSSGSEWSGAAVQAGSQSLIIINDSHSLARQESSIMHELAHLICGHEMGKFEMLSDGIFLRSYDENQEKEAEWLGGCLQLPRVALHFHYVRYKLSIEEISSKFNASEQMVQFRLNVCKVKR